MNNGNTVSKEFFIKRMTDLCVKSALADFPKNETDQQILLKSAVLSMGKTGTMTEKEVNEKLQYWVLRICRIKNFDHVTLRRYLVDSGYLTRSKDGTSYVIAEPGPRPGFFAAEIDDLKMEEVIDNARLEMERRKQEYLAKARGGK